MEKYEERTINLNDLFRAFLKHWYIIAFTVITGFIISYIMVFHLTTPKYRSTAEILVVGKLSTTGEHTTREAVTYVDSIGSLLSSDLVIDTALANINNPTTVITKGQMKSGLSVSTSPTSIIIRVSFIHEDRLLAQMVVNEVIMTAQYLANDPSELPEVNKFFQDTFFQMKMAQPGGYYSPNKSLNLMMGILLGGLIGASIVLIIDLGRNTYRSKEQIEQDLEIEVIGVIPEYEGSSHV